MDHDLTDYFLYVLAAVLVFFILVTGPAAFAGIIDTEQAAASKQAGQERERVNVLPDRQDVARQMQAITAS